MSVSRFHDYSVLRRWYKIHDSNEEIKSTEGMQQINFQDANKFNKLGYGIMMENNLFNGARKKENISRVLSWAVDLDEGTKQEQIIKIKKFLIPSVVVESKRGYHCYWHTDDQEPDADSYRNFLDDYFLKPLCADRNALDVTRTFRTPHYYHMKNPSEKFFVKIVHDNDFVYDRKTIINRIKLNSDRIERAAKRDAYMREMRTDGHGDLWAKIYEMNQMEALEVLSGCEDVDRESFNFKRTTRGKFNILVNGKGTSCFIDENGLIGSSKKGGPTIWQWLRFYGHNEKQIFQIVKKHFPGLFT